MQVTPKGSRQYICRVLLLALFYVVTGFLGLQLAVPPGYATIIWPPSGIAVGMLIGFGWEIWPGVTLGSFLINSYISGVISADGNINTLKLLASIGIATGSTFQALAAFALVRRYVGLPINFKQWRDIASMFLYVGPVACVIAASFGIGILFLLGLMPAEKVSYNWVTWWAGDVFGIVIFLPLVLLSSWLPARLLWQGKPLMLLQAIAIIAILLTLGGSYVLYDKLVEEELGDCRNLLLKDASMVKQLLEFKTTEKVTALKRMAARWNALGGIPQSLWQKDAEQYLNDLDGLKAVEWVDSTYHVRWVVPLQENQKVLGLNVLFDEVRSKALKGAADKNVPTITPAMNLIQGYKGVLAYVPVKKKEHFDGFIVWVMATDNLFNGIAQDTIVADKYVLVASSEGNEFYRSHHASPIYTGIDPIITTINIYDKQWQLSFYPTQKFISNQRSILPQVIFVAGGLIGMLMAIAAHYAVMSRMQLKRVAEASTLYEAVLWSASCMLIATDKAGVVLVFNHMAEQCLGYKADEVIHKQTPALWHEREEVVQRAGELSNELGQEVKPGFDVFVAKATIEMPQTGEWTLTRKDGSRFLASIAVSPLLDGNREVVGYLEVLNDITTDREIKQRLRDQAARSKAITDAMLDGLITIDTKGVIQSFNPAAVIIFGYYPAEVIGKNINMLMPELNHSRHDQYMQNNLNTGWGRIIGQVREVTAKRKDGSLFPMDLSVSMMEVSGNRMFVGIVRDITQRKQVQARLEESERFQAMIKESNPDHIFVKDKHFRIIDANHAFLSLYPEDKRDKVIGNTTWGSYDSKELELFKQKDQEAFEKGYSEVMEVLSYPDGKKHNMHTRKIRFENAAGEPFILGISRDVTDREQLLKKLADSNTELERFAYVASHDLQEPVRMINNFSKLLCSEYEEKLAEEGKEYLHLISDAGIRMRDIIDDLLTYSRLGNDTVRFQSFDANQVLQSALDNLKALIQQQKAEISCDKLPWLYGNPVQIMRLLQNLITNAIKYQPKENIPRIHVGFEDKNEWWEISVKDNGLGIDAQFLTQIFEPFRRLHSWDKIQGTGLGLSICKKIAENNHGRLTVTSEPGKGSTFILSLPKHTF